MTKPEETPGVTIHTHGVRPVWPLIAGFLTGLIVGAIGVAGLVDGLDENRIKAGAFIRSGVEYRITPAIRSRSTIQAGE